MYNVFIGQADLRSVILSDLGSNAYSLIPAYQDLVLTEIALASDPSYQKDRLGMLRLMGDVLEEIRNEWDYIIVDTQPTISDLVLLPLGCADYVLMPCATEAMSLLGLMLSFKVIDWVKQYLNPNLRLAGVLPTMYNRRQKLDQDTMRTLRQRSRIDGFRLFKDPVPHSVRFGEAQGAGKPIQEYWSDWKLVLPYAKAAAILDALVNGADPEEVVVGDR